MLQRVLQTIDAQRSESLERLKDFLRIPSVSTKPDHVKHMKQCAEWLHWELDNIELDAKVMPTAGHPIVLAKNAHRPDRPTVLIYGHYDVQPPEPLELWTTPPFEPTVRDGAVYARGAADDKGQVWAHVQAIAAWQRQGKTPGDGAGLPINITFLIEGEEEVGSDHLETFIKEHRDELRADIAVISDTNQFAPGVPAVTYGLRGLCYIEVFLTGPDHDLHSGLYGGAVPNPANVLCELLGSLHDQDGRVNLPGFYDEVVPLTAAEREAWRRLPFDEQEFAASLGLAHGSGEAGYSSLERKWARPTLDINGLTSGYQGPGAKTVIPSRASAKVSMRLVANMDPAKIQGIFEQTLRQRCPKNVKIEFKQHGLSGPVLVPIDGITTQLAAEALEIGFGQKPTFMREGGSIPVVGLIKRELGIDTLLIGFGLPDDRIHSPNEKFGLDALHNGTRTAAALYEKLAKLRGG